LSGISHPSFAPKFTPSSSKLVHMHMAMGEGEGERGHKSPRTFLTAQTTSFAVIDR
jgi:hypothetical protein